MKSRQSSMTANDEIISHGERLRNRVDESKTLPLVGVYDVLSATLAAERFEGIFLSGFGFAASFYGLPDNGFIAWSDMVSYAQRVRTMSPDAHIVVDIDDGYVDEDTACHVVSQLEAMGVSGVVLEDQARPRRCGHTDGKSILPADDYIRKLRAVLEARRDLFVVARTDASDPDEVSRRVSLIAETDADAVLVDGLSSADVIRELRKLTDKPFVFNQIHGGKSPSMDLKDVRSAGIAITILSTPLLFAAMAGMRDALQSLVDSNCRLDTIESSIDLAECSQTLNRAWKRSR